MRCKDAQKRLLFYLDEELGDPERRAIESHLATCLPCQEELRTLEKTQRLLRQHFMRVANETVPPRVWDAVQQRISASEGRRSDVRWAWPALQRRASWRPGWKLALSCTLAITLASTALLAPRLVGRSPAAMAREIAKDSPEIRALMDGEPAAQTVAISGDQAYVLNESVAGQSNLARVDLDSGAVREVSRLPVPLLTEEDRSRAITIAASDPDVRQLLDRGAAVSSVHLLTPVFKLGMTGGEPVVWNDGIVASVTLRANNERWIARVVTSDARVTEVSTVSEQLSPASSTEAPQEDTKEAVLQLAMSDTTVRMILSDGAEVLGVAMGGKRAKDKGAVILRLGEEMWSVTVDLSAGAVTRIWPVISDSYAKTFLFKPTP